MSQMNRLLHLNGVYSALIYPRLLALALPHPVTRVWSQPRDIYMRRGFFWLPVNLLPRSSAGYLRFTPDIKTGAQFLWTFECKKHR